MPAPLRFAVLICAVLAARGDDVAADNECLAEDTLVALRNHPLHRYVYGSAKRPDLSAGRRCRPVALTAKVVNVWWSALLIDPDKPPVRVEARTVVDGPLLDGVPRIPKRATVRIQALRCKGRRALVARRITVT